MIPDRLLLVWTGQRFPYFCRLAIESALLAEPTARIEIHVFGASPAGAEHFEHVARYERVSARTVDMDACFAGLDAPASAYQRLLGAIAPTAYSARSNLVRYGLLHARGGVYLDFDILMTGSLTEHRRAEAFIGRELVWKHDEERVHGRWSLPVVATGLAWAASYGLRRLDAHVLGGRQVFEPIARVCEAMWSTENLNNAVIGSVKGGSFIRRVLASALDQDPRVRYELGPTLVTRVAREDASDVTLLEPAVCYAVPPSASFRFFFGRPFALPPEARLIHFVSSNHRKLLETLDAREVTPRAQQGLFFALANDVQRRAKSLPRQRGASTHR